MVCIIATILLPELLLPTSLVKTEDDRRKKCARDHDTLRFAVISFPSAGTELPIPSQKLCQEHRKAGEPYPFLPTEGILARNRLI